MTSKKIPVAELTPGMYVADLGAGWMDHPFLRNHFPVNDEETVREIVASGIREVYIDPDKGLDVPDAPTEHEVRRKLEAEIQRVVARDAPPRHTGIREEMGRMAAICDVYDAITSNRVYHKGMAPHEALRKIFEWSKFHFDPLLVQQFVRAIGIYPVGTLVMLESGRIGVVLEQAEGHLLQPLLKVFFDSQRRQYITPQQVDLSQNGGDRITGYETAEKWGITLREML